MRHPFVVGETYRNEKGEYEVLSIDGDTMAIRWTDGSTWEGSVELQARIYARIQAQSEMRRMRVERPRPEAARPVDTRGREFEGLVDDDFQSEISGTSWRRRESLGGLLASNLATAAGREFESYAVYRRAEVHIASPRFYEPKVRSSQPKFVFELDPEKATFGFYIEKSDEPMDEAWHWQGLMAALEGGPELCQGVEEAMAELGLDWRIWLPRAELLAARVGLAGSMLIWAPQIEGEGEPAELTWKGFFERLGAITQGRYCDLYLAADLFKEEAIAAGAGLGDRVVAVYQALVPLYHASLK